MTGDGTDLPVRYDAVVRWAWALMPAVTCAVAGAMGLASYSRAPAIGRFMPACGRANELFLEGEPSSVPECWCDRENVATKAEPSAYRKRPKQP